MASGGFRGSAPCTVYAFNLYFRVIHCLPFEYREKPFGQMSLIFAYENAHTAIGWHIQDVSVSNPRRTQRSRSRLHHDIDLRAKLLYLRDTLLADN